MAKGQLGDGHAVYVLRSDLMDDDVMVLASTMVRAVQLVMGEYGGVADDWEVVNTFFAYNAEATEIARVKKWKK